MKSLITFLILCLAIKGFSEENSKPSFYAETTISKDNLAINEEVSLKATLKYPADFHPNIDLMKRRLINYAGLEEPPFTLVKVVDHPTQKNGDTLSQELEFILSPQIAGKHFLSLKLIPFDSNSKKSKSIEIPSNVFTIDVYIPQTTVDLKALIEPPMELSRDLPIVLSQANHKSYLANKLLIAKETKQNKSFLKNKTLPWLSLISAIAVFLVIFLIRVLPPKTKEEALDPITQEQNESEIKRELQKAILKQSTDTQEISHNINHIDFLIRKYLQNRYQFPAFSLTTQELIQEIASLKDLSADLKDKMNRVFKYADQIKFANKHPTAEEYQEVLEIVKKLSQKS